MDERVALIALSRLRRVSNIVKRDIALSFDNIGDLFEKKVGCLDGAVRSAASSFKGWGKIESDLKVLDSMGGRIATIRDAEYPPLLKHIPDAPVVLYKKGSLDAGCNMLAIVGSRRATFEGMNLAEKIAETLSSVGITVVSGFARGIDSSAHKGAVKGNGGTVAVFGCGVDVCYPPENRQLYGHIAEKGLLISEYGPQEEPLPFHFPERNRIIAGLSKGILVIEASKKSGSLITARLGLEYGREVMAIPGSVFRDEYRGANALIKQGAKLVENIDDIVSTCFPGLVLKPKEPANINREEERIFSIIGALKIHVDEVIEKSGMAAKQVMAILTKLEMKELIRETPGGFYMKR
ncbi:MAG TPA: DNA-processing protein DprA [Syntrophorhabdaceae bacterium]|nr:DNA-processing protein DprA [Syntrophorhabdaceae bacterium]